MIRHKIIDNTCSYKYKFIQSWVEFSTISSYCRYPYKCQLTTTLQGFVTIWIKLHCSSVLLINPCISSVDKQPLSRFKGQFLHNHLTVYSAFQHLRYTNIIWTVTLAMRLNAHMMVNSCDLLSQYLKTLTLDKRPNLILYEG